jgi:hypothetical protein
MLLGYAMLSPFSSSSSSPSFSSSSSSSLCRLLSRYPIANVPRTVLFNGWKTCQMLYSGVLDLVSHGTVSHTTVSWFPATLPVFSIRSPPFLSLSFFFFFFFFLFVGGYPRPFSQLQIKLQWYNR